MILVLCKFTTDTGKRQETVAIQHFFLPQVHLDSSDHNNEADDNCNMSKLSRTQSGLEAAVPASHVESENRVSSSSTCLHTAAAGERDQSGGNATTSWTAARITGSVRKADRSQVSPWQPVDRDEIFTV